MTQTLDNVCRLVPMIVERADEIERNRAMPRELIDGLRSAGVFRMYVPRSHGGDELGTVDAIEVIEELSRADGSVGWIATIGANSPAMFCRWPSATYDEIYRRGPDVIHAGSLLPRGQAVVAADRPACPVCDVRYARRLSRPCKFDRHYLCFE